MTTMKKGTIAMQKTALNQLNATDLINIMSINQNLQKQLTTRGEKLIETTINQLLNEDLITECRSYIDLCKQTKKEMYERRKEFTSQLVNLQKQFVASENAIEPGQKDAPATNLAKQVQSFLLAKKERLDLEMLKAEKNNTACKLRIEKRTDLSEEQKQVHLLRANSRLAKKQLSLSEQAIDVDYQPVCTSVEGYAEIFKFWWEGSGKNLTQIELNKHMHPMISYTKKQAKKQVFIQSNAVMYNQIPIV